TVEDGVVTLTGTVDFNHQREEAEATVRNLRGVTELHDKIRVKNPRMAADVSDRIQQAFLRSAQIDAQEGRIEAIDGTVTLVGTVQSWAEHDAAVDAAWAAPGVRDVKDQIEIAFAG